MPATDTLLLALCRARTAASNHDEETCNEHLDTAYRLSDAEQRGYTLAIKRHIFTSNFCAAKDLITAWIAL